MCCNQSPSVQYVVNIVGQPIVLAIDADLERQFSAFFRQVFPESQREPITKTPCIWIGRTERTDLPTGVRQVVCRTDSESWPFELLTTLEGHLLQIVRQTAFHGAALAREGRTLLLLGERKSGKSTLTHFLTLHDWCLVDDDCCFYAQGILSGTGFPLRLRRCLYPESDIFWQCVDTDGEERRFIFPRQRIMHSSAPFFLIFPHYEPNAEFRTEKIDRQSLFSHLILNVRYTPSGPHRIRDLSDFIRRTASAYHATYSQCESVATWIQDITERWSPE